MSNFYQKKALKYKLKYLNLLNQSGGVCMSEAEANAKIGEMGKSMTMEEYQHKMNKLMCNEQSQQSQQSQQNHGHSPPNHGHPYQIPNPGQRKDLAFIANDIGETLNIFKSRINPLLNGQKNLELVIDEFIMVMNNKLEFFKTDCNCNCVSLNKQILLS